MKRLLAGLYALALVSPISLEPPMQAQTAAVETGPFGGYTLHEVTLTGTVSGVLAKPDAGMLMGSHILLATLTGRVDVSLGRFGLRGKGALSVAAGQQIEVTGVMKTYATNNKDQQVVLARTVKVGGEIYTIRNEHGFPISPQARERASRKNAGASL
jgi:hypothetical protein